MRPPTAPPAKQDVRLSPEGQQVKHGPCPAVFIVESAGPPTGAAFTVK